MQSNLRRCPSILIVPVYVAVLVLTVFIMRRFATFQENDYLNDMGYLHFYARDNTKLAVATSERMIFMGDSITFAWRGFDPQYFSDDRIDRGIPGQTTKDLLLRFRQDVINLHPHTVHILCGVNDLLGVSGPMTIAQTEDNIETLVEVAEANHIRVIIGTILPSKSNPYIVGLDLTPEILQLNKWIRSYAVQNHIALVDYYPLLAEKDGALKKAYSIDGLHPNRAGYTVMEKALNRTLAGNSP